MYIKVVHKTRRLRKFNTLHCAHYIIETKVQWKPFWLATQQYPQNDWLGGKFPYTMTYAQGPHCAREIEYNF